MGCPGRQIVKIDPGNSLPGFRDGDDRRSTGGAGSGGSGPGRRSGGSAAALEEGGASWDVVGELGDVLADIFVESYWFYLKYDEILMLYSSRKLHPKLWSNMEQQEDWVGPRKPGTNTPLCKFGNRGPEFPLNSRIWRTLSFLKWNMLDIDIIWILYGYG